MAKLRYSVYDTTRKRFLKSVAQYDDGPDSLVTDWTRHNERALRFPGAKSARGMAKRLEDANYDGVVVLNARGYTV